MVGLLGLFGRAAKRNPHLVIDRMGGVPWQIACVCMPIHRNRIASELKPKLKTGPLTLRSHLHHLCDRIET